jgi:hypothetical protein
MKIKILFVFTLCGLFMVADTQAQAPRKGGKGGRPGQGGPGGSGGRGGPSGGRPSMMTFLPVLIALDADKDGKISASEIENAVAALKTLDKNGDGSLTEEELRPSFSGRGGQSGRPGMQGRGGQGGLGGRDGKSSGAQKPNRPQFDN